MTNVQHTRLTWVEAISIKRRELDIKWSYQQGAFGRGFGYEGIVL
jgi:hypothetical protein